MAAVLAPAIGYAEEGFPVSEVIAAEMAQGLAILGGLPRLQGDLHRRRPAHAPVRRGLAQSAAGAHPGPPGRRRPGRLLPGRPGPRDRSVPQGPGRLPGLRGLRRAHERLGRPGERGLPRLRRVGTARQRPGHRRPADAAHPRRLRFQPDPLRQPAARAPVHRGQEARLRGPGQVLRRSRLHGDPGGRAPFQGLRRPAAGPHRTRAGPPAGWRPAIRPCATATPSTSPPPTATAPW